MELTVERICCLTLASACIFRIGDGLELAYIVTNPPLFREFWLDYVHRISASQVFVWGNNTNGQLGLGDTTPRVVPKILSFFDDQGVVQISCGKTHSIALLESGAIFGFGDNIHGQLGLGDDSQRLFPEQIFSLCGKHIVDINCGDSHCLALTDTEEVFSWGENSHGQLGIEDETKGFVPTLITKLNDQDIVNVSCGCYSSFAISKSGSLFSWGLNSHSQLGLNDLKDKHLPQKVIAIPGKKITSISSSELHSIALLDSGKLLFAGNRLGLSSSATLINFTFKPMHEFLQISFTSIACGNYHSIALQENGNVFSWGDNKFGQLGTGDKEPQISPQQILTLIGKKVISISCGISHSLALVENGNVFSWGDNKFGQLGIGDTNGYEALVPLQVTALNGKHVFSLSSGEEFNIVLSE